MPLGLTEIEKATLGWGAVNQLCAPRWIISTPAHAEAASDDRYAFKWQLKGTLRRTHIWLTSPTKWFKNVTFFKRASQLYIAPSICEGASSSFFFVPQAILQGESTLTGVLSPCVPAWSPTQRQTADPTVLSLCSRLYSQHENNNTKKQKNPTQTALEAPCLWFMLFPFISPRVGDDALTKCTPRVWQFKEKIHPQIVIRCLISSVCDVQFDGGVFCLSQFPLSDCCKQNAHIVYIWPVISGKEENLLNRAEKCKK